MKIKTNNLFIGVLFLIGLLIGFYIEKFFHRDEIDKNTKIISEIISLTKNYYYEKVEIKDLIESAINGIFDKLDPHSVFIPSKELTRIEESFRGDFEGIGIEFQIVNDTLTVVTPISGGPSEQLGILPGDRIIEIENESVIGITDEEVRQKLRGKAGTQVSITIHRPKSNKKINYKITRDKIPIFSIDAAFMFNKSTAYINISRFSETTSNELLKALEKLKKQGMKKLILDFRGNPGGYLSQAVRIADYFIDGNKKIVYTTGRIKDFNEEYFASETYTYENIPLVVLINRGSASASEIVAGAIQDWDRGFIVGETSFGKGLVQRQFELSGKSAVRLTISEYFTPSGRNIQRKFVTGKSKKDYYQELLNFDEKVGENFFHENEEDSTKPVYYTLKMKRKVYGGGGITPDYIVKNYEITELTQNLLKENLFYTFTLSYLDVNADNIKKQFNGNLYKFKSEFHINDDILNSFLNYSKSKSIKINLDDLSKDLSFIKTRLKAQIARNFWKNEGWYYVILDNDLQFKKALNLIEDSLNFSRLK
jgi:carboxyl-terminal processing protease